MRQVGSHVITIASPENLFLVTDGHFKAAAGNIGTLGMGMLLTSAMRHPARSPVSQFWYFRMC